MRSYRIRKFPAKLVLLVLIIVILANPKILQGVKNFTFGILTKPLTIFSGLKEYFARVKRLSDENLLLKHRLATLSIALARMEEVSSENKRLQALLDFKKTLRYTTIAAKVIGWDLTGWRRAMIINKGRTDGIKGRMPCATAKGLIGSVAEAGLNSSKVMLITDPDSRVGVILESSRESGILIGSPEGACKIIYLSLDGDIKTGEKVLTAGFGAFFPKGLAVGKVREIGIEKTKLYKYAIVDPAEEMNKIEEVVCIGIESRK